MSSFKRFFSILCWLPLVFTVVSAAETRVQLTLEQAVDRALKQNRGILQSQEGMYRQELALERARSDFDVKLTPSAQAGVSNVTQRFGLGAKISKKLMTGQQLSVHPFVGKDAAGYRSELAFGVDVPLFRGAGKAVATDGIHSASHGIEAARDSMKKKRSQLILETIQVFYQIYFLKKRSELSRIQVSRFENHVAIAQIKTDVGLAEPLDVYRAQISANNAKRELSSVLEALHNAENALKILISFPQDQILDIICDDVILPIKVPELAEADDIAMRQNVEIAAQKKNLKETRRQVQLARHNLLPDLTLSLQYQMDGSADDIGRSFDLDDNSWNVLLSSSTDFSRTNEKIAVRQRLIDLRTAQLTLERVIEDVREEIREQRNGLEKIRERINLLQSQLHTADGKLALAQIKFDNGMAGNFDVIEAEKEVHQARLKLLSGKIDYAVGTYQISDILGTLESVFVSEQEK